MAVVNFATKNGYKLLDVRGANLILVNQINLALPDSIYPNKLEDCFDYLEQKRACKDIRIIGSKFTTNAKIFSQRPGILLKLKKFLFQLALVMNYSLRRKLIPNNKIPENCKKRIYKAGLYI